MSPLSSAARSDLERSYLSEVIQKYTFWRPQTDRVFEFARGFGKNQDSVILPPRFVPRHLLLFPGRAEMRSQSAQEAAADHLDPLEVLKKGDFVLIGEPGAGKTALLWHLLYRCALYPLIGGRIRLPIGVDVARYDPSAASLLDFIRRDLLLTSQVETGALPLPAHGELALRLDDYMSESRLVLLFDGLDALPGPVQTRCIEGIHALRETYGDIRLVVSASSAELGSRLSFSRFVLQDLDAAGQRELIDINFPDPDLPRREGQLAKIEPFATLRANPFMLLVMGAVLKDNRRVSGSRARLCQSFVQSLLALAAQASARPLPSEKAQLRALGNLALAIRTEISPGAWVPRSFALERLTPDGSAENGGAGEAEELIHAGIQSGLLYESVDGLISFSHGLLQDYFAALALRRAHLGSSRMNEVVRDPGSAGLLEMLAGLETDASPLVEHILPFDLLLAARCAAAASSLNPDLRARIAGRLGDKLQTTLAAQRLRAAEALLALSPESALSVLLPRLQEAEGPEQALLASLLDRLPAKFLLPGLQALLNDEDPWRRAWALRMLRGKGFDWPLQTIAELVSDRDPAVRVEAAAVAVAALPNERAIQQLARLLQDEDDVVRKAAARELIRFRPEELVPKLVSSYTRPWARGNRAESDPSVQEAWLPSLASLLRDNSREVRYVVAEMLAAWDGPDPLPHLVRLLAEQSQEVSWLAAQIVGRRKSEGAVPTLLSLLTGDSAAKTLAIAPLATILGPSAAPHLIPLLSHEDWYVRTSALRALCGARATAAIPQVSALLRDPDDDVRALAAAGLAELDARGAVRELVDALRDPEAKVRAAAAIALRALSPGDLGDCVRPLLDDPDPLVRAAAAEALTPTEA